MAFFNQKFMYIKSFFKYLFLTIIVWAISSCNSGHKPDKILRVNIAYDEMLKSDEKIDSIIETLSKRIHKVAMINRLERVHGKNQIYLEAATHYSSKRITDLIINQGQLKFYEVYHLDEMMDFIAEVNTLAKEEDKNEDPLFDLIKSRGYQGDAILFNVSEKDTSAVNTYLSLKSAASKLPNGKRYTKFLWGIKPIENGDIPLYALKLNKQGKPALSGEVVKQARQEFDQLARPIITIMMNEEGSKIWEDLTGRVFEQRSQIAMGIDDKVYSAPGVSSGPIFGGMSQISGDFTVEQAQDLANILNSGVLPKMSLLEVTVEKLKE